MAAYAALVSLMNIIDNLQHHPLPPISLHHQQVHLLTQKVIFLQEFLESYNPHLGYSAQADPLEIRIADAAYAVEDVIESHIVDQITSNGEKISSDDSLYEALEKVIEEMALIEKETMEIEGSVGIQDQILDSSRSSSSSIGQKSSMVGVDDVKLQMMDKLTADCRDLQIIPIVGMGGSGKTTLARNISQDRLIKEHFHICAWTTISQEYSIRQVLVEVLKQLNIEEVSQDSSVGVIGEMLYKHLYGRKYLIIMDDMWSIDAWNRVRNYFPDNKNGSRIVVTTRLSNLASELHSSEHLEMKLLDEADSWDLLSKTVFGEKACPLELEKIGKKIGKSCKGLPLSVVVVGGLLAKSKHTREFWEHIWENLNAIVNLDDNERCLKVLHMSYKQLPIYLKPCFLYMGIFPEDEDIRISRLAKVWAAEGFLKPVSGKSLEEVAKVYLNELIDRNLILIDAFGSIGNTKYCKIHDLVRDLCLREAKKERFYTPQGIVNVGQHRHIVISSNEDMDALLSSSPLSLARSLMWNLEGEEVPPLSFLRLLRIIDSCRVQPIASAEFLHDVHHLVNSRFLDISVQQAECEFPFPISLFWNLQTLIVDGLMEFTAPTEIWCMPHIRHVRFLWLHLPDPPITQDHVVLENLQSLRTVLNFKCGEQVVKRIPNIKKLVIFYDEVLDDDRYRLTNLDCLDKLESLTCTCPRRTNESLERLISFPDSIKKLSLVVSPSQYWQQILEKIGSLPLLEKLTLESGSFEEGKWHTSEGQFCSLKFLAVRECKGLHVWTTESSHFPRLDHLLLDQVDELEEIPLDFAEVSTLRVIDVCFGSHSSMVSAKRIVDEQEELYGEAAALQVQVTLLSKNEALESLASPNFRVKYT